MVNFNFISRLLQKGYTDISPLWNNIFANIFAFFIQVPVVLYLSRGQFNWPSLPIALLIFTATAFYMLYPYVLSKGEVTLTGTVMSTYPLSTIILSGLFLKEIISIPQLLGALLVISGIILIGLPNKKIAKKVKNYSWLFLALGFAFLNGSGDFFSKIVINNIGAYSQIFFSSFIFLLYSLPNYALDKPGRHLPKFSLKKFWPTLIGTLLLPTGTLFYFLAFDYGPASLIAPTSAIYQVITVILAVIFLKEKVSLRQLVGISGSILGVALIGFNAG